MKKRINGKCQQTAKKDAKWTVWKKNWTSEKRASVGQAVESNKEFTGGNELSNGELIGYNAS